QNFHAALLRASGNAFVASLISGITAAVTWTTIFKQRHQQLARDPVPDHARVYEAVRAGNPAAAQRAMTALLDLALLDTTSARRPARRRFERKEIRMPVSGKLFIGGEQVATAATFQAVNAAAGESLQPSFSAAGNAEVERACALAWSAFEPFRALELDARARFLETIADRIQALGDELLERGHAETGLPIARLTGERGRTMGQLRLFADELRKGGWLGLRVDPAMPDRKPLPRSDLRQRKVPLGPVVVFGASNFPLAFSVAGGDTAAALAAGCPVIVKGHSAHPGTSDLVAQAITAAVKACDLPPGVFSLLNGNSRSLGASLVAHPRVKAVGFTGSRAGGLALMKIASERPEPIPVYAEMSSINPVFLLPAAMAERAEKLGQDFVGSLTLGVGQFCTNPGLAIALESPELERFIAAAGAALGQVAPGVMLTAGIHAAYEKGVQHLLDHDKVTL